MIKAIELEKYNHKVVEYKEFSVTTQFGLGIVEDSVLYNFYSREEVYLGDVVKLHECNEPYNKLRFKDRLKESFYYDFSLSYTLQGFDDFEKSQDGKAFVPFRSSMELKELMTEQLSELYDEIEKIENDFYNVQSDFGWAENHDDETIYRFDFEDYLLHYESIIYGQESDELPF